MSDENRPAGEAVADAGKRPPADIDLGKNDVKELARAPSRASEPVEKLRIDPVRSYVEARLEQAEPAATVATPQAAVAKPGRAGAVFGGALAGGILGMVSAIGYATVNAPPAQTPDPRIAALETTVGGIDRRLSGANPDIERLAAALKAAEGRIAAIDARPPAVPKAVEDRLAGLDQALAGAREQAASALRRIDGIEKLASAPPAAESAPQPEAQRVDLAPIAARIVKLEEAIAATDRKAASGVETTAALDARLKSAETSVAGLAKPRASESAGAILAIGAMLRRALEAGEALAPMLTALTALGAAPDDLKAMAAFADRPPPRVTALVSQFDDLAARQPKATPPESAKEQRDLSVADRLKANIATLVEVRPAGAPRPAEAGGASSSLRAALVAGDLAGFARAAASLTAEQRAAFKPVLDAVAERASAIQAIDRLESSALGAAARRN